MLEILIKFPMKEDAYKANEKLCSLFQGQKSFIDNDVIITPIKESDTYSKIVKNNLFEFSIIFNGEGESKKVEFEAAELDVMGIKKVWSFA